MKYRRVAYAQAVDTNAKSHEPQPPSEASKALAEVLRLHNARDRVRQEDVARAIGRTQPYVSLRINGKAGLTIDELFAWTALLGEHPAEVIAEALGEDWRRLIGIDPVDPDLRVLADLVEEAEASVIALSVSPPPDDESLPAAAHPRDKRKSHKGMESDHDGA